MAIQIIRREKAKRNPLADTSGGDELRQLLDRIDDPALTATERLKARRFLRLHLQVMRLNSRNDEAVAYIERRLETSR